MPGPAFGCRTARGPFPASPVTGAADDAAQETAQGVPRAPAAVLAAGIAPDPGADHGQDGGEADLVGAGAGEGRGAGGQRRDHVMDEEERPGFLPGQDGRPAAQDTPVTAQRFLQVQERDFSRPLLIPVKKKSSLAFRVHPGRY